MLDSFHEEIRKKRNAYAIFWGIVFLFAVLLYMFFQGYYFSIQVGFERLLHQTPPTTGSGAPESLLKSFGIINLKVDPNPTSMTVNGLPYKNWDKQIFDYGKYALDVQNSGYLPLKIQIELSKANPFYLNNVRLLKVPTEVLFAQKIESIEQIGTLGIAKTLSGGYFRIMPPYASGSLISLVGSGGLSGSGNLARSLSGMTLQSLGEWYFTASGKIWSLDPIGTLVLSDAEKWIVLCPEARMVRWDIYCPRTGIFLTGKYKDLKEKIIEANHEFIRTGSSIIRLGGTFFNSSTPLTTSVNFAGNSTLVTYKDRLMLLNAGHMYDMERGLIELRIPELDTIATTKKFWDEILTIGRKSGKNITILEDGKNEALKVDLGDRDTQDVQISQHSGAYFIATKSEVIVYYKGSTELLSLAKWQILGVMDTTIFYNREGSTYSLTLEGIE